MPRWTQIPTAIYRPWSYAPCPAETADGRTSCLGRHGLGLVGIAGLNGHSSATAGSDYIAASGTLTFAAGVKKQLVTVLINGDKVVEPDEIFKVLLSNPVNVTIADGTGLGLIKNNDAVSIGTSTIARSAAQEVRLVKLSPNPAATKTYVRLTGYTGIVNIQLSSLDGRVLRQQKTELSASKKAELSIDVTGLANGVYFITVIDEKGSRHAEKLVVIH